jgi:hypothetical protein
MVWFFALLDERKLSTECVILVIPWKEGTLPSAVFDTYMRVCCAFNRSASGR